MKTVLGIIVCAAIGFTAVQGDVNDDGTFSTTDCNILQRYITGNGSVSSLGSADLDNNGSVNVFDLCIMKRQPLTSENGSGKILFHSYSDYTAGDSCLKLFDIAENKLTVIESDVFYNAMNGDFGSTGSDIVFMAITRETDSWDIYRCNTDTVTFTNLTFNSGYRNEDPKFSPDGSKIVFKRGRWDNSCDCFIYDLAEINTENGEITVLTNTLEEESMPYYSADGSCIYYACGVGEGSGIYMLDTATHESHVVYDCEGIQEYYPIVYGKDVYFASWLSSQCQNDGIFKMEDENAVSMAFNSADYNCSDPCPTGNNSMIYSCTKNGSYDLYVFNGTESRCLNMLNTGLHELGTAFFTET